MKNIIEIAQFFELEEDFTKKDLKRAYANKIKEYHPEDSPQEFINIQNMYEYALEYLKGDIYIANIFDLANSDSTLNLENDEKSVEPYDYFNDLFSKHKITYKSFDDNDDVQKDINVEIEIDNNDYELIKEELKNSIVINEEILSAFENISQTNLIYLYRIVNEFNYSKSYSNVHFILNQEQIRSILKNDKNFRYLIGKYFYYNIFDFDLRTSKYICTTIADYDVIKRNISLFYYMYKKRLKKLEKLDLQDLIYLNEVLCDFHYNHNITYTQIIFNQDKFLNKLQTNEDFFYWILKYFKLNFYRFNLQTKKYICEEASFIAPHFNVRRIFLNTENKILNNVSTKIFVTIIMFLIIFFGILFGLIVAKITP